MFEGFKRQMIDVGEAKAPTNPSFRVVDVQVVDAGEVGHEASLQLTSGRDGREFYFHRRLWQVTTVASAGSSIPDRGEELEQRRKRRGQRRDLSGRTSTAAPFGDSEATIERSVCRSVL